MVNLTRAVTNAQNLRRIRTKSGPLVLKFYTWLEKFYSNLNDPTVALHYEVGDAERNHHLIRIADSE